MEQTKRIITTAVFVAFLAFGVYLTVMAFFPKAKAISLNPEVIPLNIHQPGITINEYGSGGGATFNSYQDLNK